MHHNCPDFETCSVNVCPLCSNSSTYTDKGDRENTCRISEELRTLIKNTPQKPVAETVKEHRINPPTPTEIEAWVKRVTRESQCGCPVYSGWATNLWRKPYDEIVEFLIDRFETTLHESEYYLCILHLEKHVPKETLYVPFSQSPQYMEVLRTYIDNTPKKKGRIKGIKEGKTRNGSVRSG